MEAVLCTVIKVIAIITVSELTQVVIDSRAKKFTQRFVPAGAPVRIIIPQLVHR